MKYKTPLFITILVLLLIQLAYMSIVYKSNSLYTNVNKFSDNQIIKNESFEINSPSGMENIKTNVLRNGGFEEEAYNYGPENFYYWGSSYGFANSTYKEDVYSGTYAGSIAAKGTEQFSASYSNSRSLTISTPYAYIEQMISMELWVQTKTNPDIASGSSTYFRVRLSSSGGSYSLYYYLSTSSVPTNSTNDAYFDIRNVVGSWFYIERNVTLDVLEAFGSYDSTWYIQDIYFYSFSIREPTGETLLLLDDVNISNSTSYEFLEDNGDFDDGDSYPWSSFRVSPAYAYLTTEDKTEGYKALNMTTASLYNNAYASIILERTIYSTWQGQPVGYYAIQPNDCVVHFDWKYSDPQINTLNHYVYFYLHIQNSSYTASYYFILGQGADTLTFTNYTGPTYLSRYYLANGFGLRDVWQHFNVDVYTLLNSENLTNLVLTYIGVYMQTAYAADSWMQLLIDDLHLITYPTGDPSFEQAWGWSATNPIPSWDNYFFPEFCNLTTNAYSGNFAANVTSHGNVNSYIFRDMFLPLQENLYTDFWWKLDYISSQTNSYSIITLTLDNSYFLNYILGASADIFWTNSSNYCYYFVDKFNATGIWNNIFRDIKKDVISAFGENKWNITQIRLECNVNNMIAKVSTLFDDMNFISDVTPPEMSNLKLTPDVPQYGQAVTVELDAIDNIDVFSVELCYKVLPGSYIITPMIVNDSKYSGELPPALWNTTVRFYIVARDIYNHISTLGTDVDPLTYIVQDFIDPIFNVEYPLTNETLKGAVQFNITGNDVGSGIGIFEVIIEGETVFSNTSILSEFIWQTKDYVNGEYTITFSLADKAGNTVNINLTYVIKNTPFIDFIQKWWLFLAGGAGGLLIGIIVIAIIVKIKKH